MSSASAMMSGMPMTRCPICRGAGDPDCLCEDGLIEAELIVNHEPEWTDTAWLLVIATVCLVPWIVAGWAIWHLLA